MVAIIAEQIIVMGVSGCGKSTVGQALAKRLSYPFYDGDDFHPKKNIEKMQQGTPLTDTDRQGWLETLNKVLLSESNGVVLACSALKPDYRQTLIRHLERPLFVYLKGDFDEIWVRHKNRKNHYFQGRAMLQSQFDTLIEPAGNNVITVSVTLNVKEIVEKICRVLQGKN